jgi:hypothetical protein
MKWLMPAFGPKRTFGGCGSMSAFGGKDGVIGRRLVDSWKILGAALQADGETGSPLYGPQASEGEAQHGLFCWTGRFGQGHERLHCG